jgi:hypothetical protein
MSSSSDDFIYTWTLRGTIIILGAFTIVATVFLLLNVDFSLKKGKVETLPTAYEKGQPTRIPPSDNMFTPAQKDTHATDVIAYINRNLSDGLCTDIADVQIPVIYVPTFIVPASNNLHNACDVYDNAMLLFFLCTQNERGLASKVANSLLGSSVMSGWWPVAASSDARILHYEGLQERYNKETGRADYGTDNSLRAGAQTNCFVVMALARFVTYYADDINAADLVFYVRCAYDTFVSIVYPRLCDKGKYKGYFDLNQERRVTTTDNIAVNAAGKQLLTLIDAHGTGDMVDKKADIQTAVDTSSALVTAMYFETTMSNECFATPQLTAGTEGQLFTATVACNTAVDPDCECGEELDCSMTLATQAVTWAQLNDRMITDIDKEVRLATWLTTNVSIVDTDSVPSGCGPASTTPCSTSYININTVFNGQKFSSQGSQIMWATSGQSVMMLYDVFVNRLTVENTYIEGSLKRTYTGLQKMFGGFGSIGVPATFCEKGSWQYDEPAADKADASVKQVTTKQRNGVTISGFNALNFYRYTHLSSSVWCTLGLAYVDGEGDNGYNIFSKLSFQPKDFPDTPVGTLIRPLWISDYVYANRVSCFFEAIEAYPTACAGQPALASTAGTIISACNQLATLDPKFLNDPPPSYAKLKVTANSNWSNVCLPSPYFTSCSGEKQAFGTVTALTLARKDGGCSL